MIDIDGIILVITCNKYIESRIIGNPHRLMSDSISGWEIFYVVGNETIQNDYEIEYDENIQCKLIKVKCCDNYLYLFKKIVLAQQVVHGLFNIKKGILKCDDDILFVKEKLQAYLSSPLDMAYSAKRYDNIKYTDVFDEPIKTIKGTDTHHYFYKNPNIYKEIRTEINIRINTFRDRFILQPSLPPGYGGSGGVYFISTNSSKIIISYFAKCAYDLFHRDKETNSYPFIAEDIGTCFILYKEKVVFTANNNIYSHASWRKNDDLSNVIGFHTHLQGKSLTPGEGYNNVSLEPLILELLEN